MSTCVLKDREPCLLHAFISWNFLSLQLCVCVWGGCYMSLCTCMCKHMLRSEETRFLYESELKSVSLPYNPPNNLATSKLQTSPCLCAHNTAVPGWCGHARLFAWVLQIQTQTLMLVWKVPFLPMELSPQTLNLVSKNLISEQNFRTMFVT